MSRETLKDAHYRIVGYIEAADSGRQTGKNAHFRIVGYYDPQTNQTKDAHFRVVGYGNTLATMIICT